MAQQATTWLGAQPPASASAEEGHILSLADSATSLGQRRKSESDLAAAAAHGRAESARLDFRDPCFIERQARPALARPPGLALHHSTGSATEVWLFPASYGCNAVTAGHATG